jgi:hypothetical protein
VDLLAGLLFLATISAFWLLLMEPHQHRHWWLFLGTASLLALHRPITISQLRPTLLVISGWQWPSAKAFIRTPRPKDWIAVLCTAAVLGVFLQPSVPYIYEYYFVSSVDVGAAKSPVDAARFALMSMAKLLGPSPLFALLVLHSRCSFYICAPSLPGVFGCPGWASSLLGHPYCRCFSRCPAPIPWFSCRRLWPPYSRMFRSSTGTPFPW